MGTRGKPVGNGALPSGAICRSCGNTGLNMMGARCGCPHGQALSEKFPVPAAAEAAQPEQPQPEQPQPDPAADPQQQSPVQSKDDEVLRLAQHIAAVVGAPQVMISFRGAIHTSVLPNGTFHLEVDESWRLAFALRTAIVDHGLISEEAMEAAEHFATLHALRQAAVTIEARAAEKASQIARPPVGLAGPDGRPLTPSPQSQRQTNGRPARNARRVTVD